MVISLADRRGTWLTVDREPRTPQLSQDGARSPFPFAGSGLRPLRDPWPREPSGRRRPTVVGMVSAWLFVTLAGLAALATGAGAYRLARRPKAGRR
jgi:hypothetical protein